MNPILPKLFLKIHHPVKSGAFIPKNFTVFSNTPKTLAKSLNIICKDLKKITLLVLKVT